MIAEQFEEWTADLVAWSLPHSFRLHLRGERPIVRNQWGTLYHFNDGSSAFVRKGESKAKALI